jgi:hypothetical protein
MIQEYSVEDITVAAICPKIDANGIDDYIRTVRLPNVVSNRLKSFLRMTGMSSNCADPLFDAIFVSHLFIYYGACSVPILSFDSLIQH